MPPQGCVDECTGDASDGDTSLIPVVTRAQVMLVIART